MSAEAKDLQPILETATNANIPRDTEKEISGLLNCARPMITEIHVLNSEAKAWKETLSLTN